MNRLKKWYYTYQITRYAAKGVKLLQKILTYSDSGFYHDDTFRISKKLNRIEKKLIYYQAKLQNKTEDQILEEIDSLKQDLDKDDATKPMTKKTKKRVKK